MKEKYIEERWPPWFRVTTTQDDVSDVDQLAFATCRTRDQAEELCARHNDLIRALADMANAFESADSQAFKEYWYE